jgi:2-C-methyl-D-erythritol 2,4-cyclodiphosphate synthase
MKFRIGIGYDLHRLGPSNLLVLGGVEIPHEKGLIGHSDGDVLSHAITDALLGACGLSNIGEMFPDTDDRNKGISSLKFLRKTAEFIRKKGYEIGNIDSNILAEKPRLLPYFPEMQSRIAEVLGIPAGNVHVKAKTMEHLGIVGSEQAMAAEAVALVFIE